MADKNLSLINLDGASDVVIRLLDMIQDAVGWVVTPHGSRKDNEEALVVYKKSIEGDETLDGITKAAKISSARKELKQYINQGKVIAYAIEDLAQNAKLEVEDDWLSYFFDYAQNISDESIQKIWGRILAEHCNGDTSIKRMLIHTLSLLDAESAKAFGNLCRITIHCPYSSAYMQLGNKFVSKHVPLVLSPVLYGLNLVLPESDIRHIATKEYVKCIPKPNELAVLQEIGLVELPEKRGVDFEYPYNFGLVHHDFSGKNNTYKLTDLKEYIIEYGNEKYAVEPQNINRDELLKIDSKEKLPEKIRFGNVKFSTVGETLYNIINAEKLSNFSPILRTCVESQKFYLKQCLDL